MLERIKELRIKISGKEGSLTKQVSVNSAFSFSTNFVSRLGGLIFTILLARTLLPELFGVYNLVLSLIVTLAIFTDLGINAGLSRYLAESLSKGKKGEAEARSRFRFLLKLKIGLSLIVSAGLFFLAPIISNFIFNKPELMAPLQIGALYLFAMAIQGFFATVFYPLRKFQYGFISEIIFQILRIGIFALLILTYKSVQTVFWALIIATLVSFIFYFSIILAKNKNLLFGKLLPIERRRISVFLGWTVILSASSAVFWHIDAIMLGIFVPNEFLGYYGAIFSFVGAVMGLISFGAIFLPVFTEISKERLERGFRKAMKYSAILAAPAAIGLAFIIIPAIRIVYGAAYVPDMFYLPIMIAAVLISLLIIEGAFSGIYNSLLMAKEKIKKPAVVLAILTMLNILLNYIFIKIALPFGAIWALPAVASATFLSRYANLLALEKITRKTFNFSLPSKDIFFCFLASFVMLGFLLAFEYFFNPGIWLSLFMIVIAAGVYFAVLAAFYIHRT